LKIPELIAEVDDFGLSLLEKVFKAVESNFDDALEYFQSLNTSNLNREEKSKVLENFEDADFKNAMKKIVQARIEKELQKVELSEIPFDLMEGLYVAKWKSEEIFNIVTSSMQGLSKENGKVMVQKLFKCFEIASDYSLGHDELANVLEEVKRSLFRRNSGKTIELESIFHSRALKLFTKSQEKNVDELLSEIAELNEDLKLDLKKDFLSVKKALIRVQIDKEAKDLNKDDIKTWADQVKNHRIEPSKEQRIAVVVQASNLFNKYTARDVQVLALIMLYKSSIGTLAQINTGEGKTNIIAMLAVLYALEGKKVDIGELISNTVIVVSLTNCFFPQ
jgi:golgin subfamily B member 1